MNRRNFVLSASVLAAFGGNQALAQRGSRSASTILTSELTGGKIDISGTSLEMVNFHIDDADGSEHVHFKVEREGQFDIYFWPQKNSDSGEFVQWWVDTSMSIMPGEVLGSEDFGDGGYIAYNSYQLAYYEYQRDAYPGHDIVIIFHAEPDIFEEVFAEAQKILIDGAPPFLFQEDSGIFDIAKSEMEKQTAATSGTTSRTSRGSSNTAEESSESETTRGTRNSRETNAATESSGPIEAVNTHRNEFWSTYGEFYDLIDVLTADGASDKEVEDTFMLMLNIALDWQGYPARAAEVSFTRDLAGLEAAYLNWADGVALLGTTFETFAFGEAEIDLYLEANEAFAPLDKALELELGGTANSFKINREPIALLQRYDRTRTIV